MKPLIKNKTSEPIPKQHNLKFHYLSKFDGLRISTGKCIKQTLFMIKFKVEFYANCIAQIYYNIAKIDHNNINSII